MLVRVYYVVTMSWTNAASNLSRVSWIRNVRKKCRRRFSMLPLSAMLIAAKREVLMWICRTSIPYGRFTVALRTKKFPFFLEFFIIGNAEREKLKWECLKFWIWNIIFLNNHQNQWIEHQTCTYTVSSELGRRFSWIDRLSFFEKYSLYTKSNSKYRLENQNQNIAQKTIDIEISIKNQYRNILIKNRCWNTKLPIQLIRLDEKIDSKNQQETTIENMTKNCLVITWSRVWRNLWVIF